MPTLSLASTLTVTMPCIYVPSTGLIIDTLGGIASVISLFILRYRGFILTSGSADSPIVIDWLA